MFDSARRYFLGETSLEFEKSGKPTESDVQVAVAVLLLEMAHGDGSYTVEELDTIFKSVGRQFGLEPRQILELLNTAELSRRSRVKFDSYIETIKNHFTEQQRELILSLLWRVVQADGKVHRFEQTFAVTLREKLGLSVEQAIRARKFAEKRKI